MKKTYYELVEGEPQDGDFLCGMSRWNECQQRYLREVSVDIENLKASELIENFKKTQRSLTPEESQSFDLFFWREMEQARNKALEDYKEGKYLTTLRPVKYYAKVIEDMEIKKGCWHYLQIGIFNDKHEQIGEYTRNYSQFYDTFHPFELDGQWYALYSKDYTSTRIMSLPDCKDLGGEERDKCGFCPVEFYVPTLEDYDWYMNEEKAKKQGRKPPYEPYMEGWINSWKGLKPTLAFKCGCCWGDDSGGWKLQMFDISEAKNGILKPIDIGYIELTQDMKLKDCIRLDSMCSADDKWITISVSKRIYLDKDNKKTNEE